MDFPFLHMNAHRKHLLRSGINQSIMRTWVQNTMKGESRNDGELMANALFDYGVRRASRITDTFASAEAEAAGFERAANYGVFLLASDPTRMRFSTV